MMTGAACTSPFTAAATRPVRTVTAAAAAPFARVRRRSRSQVNSCLTASCGSGDSSVSRTAATDTEGMNSDRSRANMRSARLSELSGTVASVIGGPLEWWSGRGSMPVDGLRGKPRTMLRADGHSSTNFGE